METTIIIFLVTILVGISIKLFNKSNSDKFSLNEIVNLKSENEILKINLAKAEEKSDNLQEEKQNITHLLKGEHDRLIKELSIEREKLAQASQSLEGMDAGSKRKNY